MRRLIMTLLLLTRSLEAQVAAPNYAMCRLDAVYPAGGQAGQTVTVEFLGAQGGMQFPTAILIDGPPGITAGEIKSLDSNRIEVPLTIATDAAPGRRAVRVVTEQAGLTNLAWFVVGKLPERVETEPNNSVMQAEVVTLPVTVNGRIQVPVDVDSYRFTAKTGQKLVAAAMAHALDAHGQSKDYGIVDAQLELVDGRGKVVAEAQDTLGLDPVIDYVIPADGEYVIRVQLMGYRGYPQAVYRLVLGETPVPFAPFPAGLRRGESTSLRVFGWNVPENVFRQITSTHPTYPHEWVTVGGEFDSGWDVPLHVSDLPELIEQEPNNDRLQATALGMSSTINGRFETEGDEDWYRLDLSSQQPVWLETFAHRFVKSPTDTLLQVYDAEGKFLQEADEGLTDPGYERFHDFSSTDSRLVFTPSSSGVYFVKVTEANRGHGPRFVYRLQCRPAEPDFELIQFPDAIPIWGPGSTAGLLVKIERQMNFEADIELTVEGLSPGWMGSRHVSPWKDPQKTTYYSTKTFLTITAPADAPPGTVSEFRIVGRAKVGDKLSERTAIPLSLFYTSDNGFFRASPVSRAAVARPQGPTLVAETTEVTFTLGEQATVPVKVLDTGDAKELSITANVCSNGVAATWGSPIILPIADGRVQLPLQVPESVSAGRYSLVISRAWGADIRVGMPGPSTRVITLTVLPKP